METLIAKKTFEFMKDRFNLDLTLRFITMTTAIKG